MRDLAQSPPRSPGPAALAITRGNRKRRERRQQNGRVVVTSIFRAPICSPSAGSPPLTDITADIPRTGIEHTKPVQEHHSQATALQDRAVSGKSGSRAPICGERIIGAREPFWLANTLLNDVVELQLDRRAVNRRFEVELFDELVGDLTPGEYRTHFGSRTGR